MRNKLFLIAVLLSMILLPFRNYLANEYRQRWTGAEG